MVLKPEFLVPTFMEVEAINHYFEIESSFMPESIFYANPANLKIRRLAVSVISTHWMGENIDAFVPYLAMNYFDRYASRNPNSDAEVPLVAICCLTIASKMRTHSFSLELFPRNRYDYSHKKIRRMELRILNGLEWRMRPVTPFCFLDHFYPTFFNIGGFKRRCINEIIVQAQGEDNFVKYKPSDIAFSSFLAATLIRYPSKFPSIDKLDEQSRLHNELAAFCRKKGIKIECAEGGKASSSCAAATIHQGQSKGSSSCAAATIHQGQSEGSSSCAAATIHQGPSESSSSSAAATIHQGISEGSSSIAAAAIHQGISEGSSSSAAAAIHQGQSEGSSSSAAATIHQGQSAGSSSSAAAGTETESEQQRPKGADTSEGVAAVETETETNQQRLEAVLDTSKEDAPSETESEKQRRLDKGKEKKMEEDKDEDEDEDDTLEQLFQRILGKRTPIPEIVPAAEAAAPRRLMIFELTWPTNDPFIDESRIPTIRHPTMQPFNVQLRNMNEDIGCCEFLSCGRCYIL